MKAEELKELRAKSGLTQRECWEALKVSRMTYVFWETGRVRIGLAREKQIKAFFEKVGLAPDISVYPTLKAFIEGNPINPANWGGKYGISRQAVNFYMKDGYRIDEKAKEIISPKTGKRVKLEVVK